MNNESLDDADAYRRHHDVAMPLMVANAVTSIYGAAAGADDPRAWKLARRAAEVVRDASRYCPESLTDVLSFLSDRGNWLEAMADKERPTVHLLTRVNEVGNMRVNVRPATGQWRRFLAPYGTVKTRPADELAWIKDVDWLFEARVDGSGRASEDLLFTCAERDLVSSRPWEDFVVQVRNAAARVVIETWLRLRRSLEERVDVVVTVELECRSPREDDANRARLEVLDLTTPGGRERRAAHAMARAKASSDAELVALVVATRAAVDPARLGAALEAHLAAGKARSVMAVALRGAGLDPTKNPAKRASDFLKGLDLAEPGWRGRTKSGKPCRGRAIPGPRSTVPPTTRAAPQPPPTESRGAKGEGSIRGAAPLPQGRGDPERHGFRVRRRLRGGHQRPPRAGRAPPDEPGRLPDREGELRQGGAHVGEPGGTRVAATVARGAPPVPPAWVIERAVRR